jgi:hypothetical protein
MNRILLPATAALLLIAGLSAHASAAEKKKNSLAKFSSSSLSFSSTGPSQNTSVSISGPKGFAIQKHAMSGMPQINLYQNGILVDGLYLYEITTSAGKLVFIEDQINNGRGENNSHYARKGITQSGHFRVVNGQIKQYKNIAEPKFQTSY